MTNISLTGTDHKLLNDFLKYIIEAYSVDIEIYNNDYSYEKASKYSYGVEPLLTCQIIYFFRTNIGPSYVLALLQVVNMGRIQETRWAKGFYSNLALTPQDLLDVFAILHKYNLKPTNAMKKGYAMAFQNFSEYDLGGYLSVDHDVQLIDIVNLVHPKGTLAIEKLIKRKLTTAVRMVEELDYDKLDLTKKAINSDLEGFIEKVSSLRFR